MGLDMKLNAIFLRILYLYHIFSSRDIMKSDEIFSWTSPVHCKFVRFLIELSYFTGILGTVRFYSLSI